MAKIVKKLESKVNHLIYSLICMGAVMLMLAVLVVWSGFLLQLAVGLFIVVLAYSFFYLAYKIWSIKKEVEKYLKF